MTPIAISLHNVNAAIGSRQVLKDINLDIKLGKWTNIIGPNGAGKSSLLKVLAGLMSFSGEVSFPMLGPSSPTSKEKARHIAWFGQNQASADELSVYDVAMLGRVPHQGWLTAPSQEDRFEVESALKRTQAWDLKGRALKDLSGGERQRALLARALAVKSDILLMDEPLANLDPPHQVDLLDTVMTLISEQKTVISVLHEVSIALLGDDAIILNCGQIQHQGSCSDVKTHKSIEQVFENRIRIDRIQDRWISLPRMISDI